MSEQLPSVFPPAPVKTNVLSIVSLVGGILGVLSLCASFIPFVGLVCIGLGVLCAIVSLFTGFIGLGQIKINAEKGKGMAIAGIIMAGITLLGLVVMVIVNLVLGPIIGNVFSEINSKLVSP
ncbi:MAG: DUF4190 domain-containing protein [Chloroflexi bacterium]|jgi:hypothetical protein|nr:DUF4190 domain-containing protein [Chloroflexota bacterium]